MEILQGRQQRAAAKAGGCALFIMAGITAGTVTAGTLVLASGEANAESKTVAPLQSSHVEAPQYGRLSGEEWREAEVAELAGLLVTLPLVSIEDSYYNAD